MPQPMKREEGIKKRDFKNVKVILLRELINLAGGAMRNTSKKSCSFEQLNIIYYYITLWTCSCGAPREDNRCPVVAVGGETIDGLRLQPFEVAPAKLASVRILVGDPHRSRAVAVGLTVHIQNKFLKNA